MMKNGFTQIELLVVVVILTVLFSMGGVILNSFVNQDLLAVEVQKVESLISEARLRTVAGISQTESEGLNYGIHFETDRYLLFSGTVFDDQDAHNQVFLLPDTIRIQQIDLPGDNLIFAKVSGEVLDFDPNQNSLILEQTKTATARKISINRLGTFKAEKP